jgi:hypothetical protein
MRIVNPIIIALGSCAALAYALGAAAQHLGQASDIPFDTSPLDMTGSTESTEWVTGSTESTEWVTGSTESTEWVTGSTESTEWVTGSRESTEWRRAG